MAKLRLKRSGSTKKASKKPRNQLRKPRLKTFDENVDLDEKGPFDDDTGEEIGEGVLPKSKHIDLKEPVPNWVIGSKSDPFKNKPRAYLFEREFAIVVDDNRGNLAVWRYGSQFDARTQDVVTKYRHVGYYSSLSSAVVGIQKCLMVTGMRLGQGQELKDLLAWIDNQNKTLLEEVTKATLFPSSSGPDGS